jgi:catechol 2,3-dioxygenase
MTPHLGHVHLKVRDLERAVAFYTDVFGLAVTERAGRFAFLSFGDHHHDVALQEIAATAPDDDPAVVPASAAVGLYHAAFEVDDEAALRAVYETLQERGVDVSPVDHRISKALYFEDSSGNGLEAYVDTRESADEQWEGTNRRFDPTML